MIRVTVWHVKLTNSQPHLCGLQHILYDLVHVGRQPLRLQLQHLHQASAHLLAYTRVCVMSRRKQPGDVAAATDVYFSDTKKNWLACLPGLTQFGSHAI